MSIQDIKEQKELYHQALQEGKITLSTYLSMMEYLDDREHKLQLAYFFNAPRELTLKEAQRIDPRYNERMGKIKMNKEGYITVEHPYPGHKVVFCGSMTRGTHIIIDGVDRTNERDSSDYYFGIK